MFISTSEIVTEFRVDAKSIIKMHHRNHQNSKHCTFCSSSFSSKWEKEFSCCSELDFKPWILRRKHRELGKLLLEDCIYTCRGKGERESVAKSSLDLSLSVITIGRYKVSEREKVSLGNVYLFVLWIWGKELVERAAAAAFSRCYLDIRPESNFTWKASHVCL